MGTHARPSGIPAVGDVAWGTHFCRFYATNDDLFDSLALYFRAGVVNNEECVWITSGPKEAREARECLRAVMPDLEELERNGRIELVDHRDWYERMKQADPGELLAGWGARANEAVARGREGVRFVGNLSWVPKRDRQRFAVYEGKLNRELASQRIIGACSYSLEQLGTDDVLDVIENHQFSLARRPGADWRVIENASLKLAREELRKLNEGLDRLVRERTAQLEVALRAREEFLSVASHELKTPVTALRLYVDGLLRSQQRSSLPDELSKRLHLIREQALRLERLSNHLLDVTRASNTGQIPLSLDEVDLGALVREVVDTMQGPARRAGCTIDLRVESEVRGLWDRTRLEQIVINLLSNAFKFAPGRPIHITVGQTDGTATLRLRDEGIGISPKDQQRIFERFTQVAPGSRSSGFGVGLWIVRQILDALGGDIRVTSELGKGATFTVTLPLVSHARPSSETGEHAAPSVH